jgi:hypothetical protein
MPIQAAQTHPNTPNFLRLQRAFPNGPARNISVLPVVGGWVRGQKRTGVRFIFAVFFYSLIENAQKRDKNINPREKIGFIFFADFFVQLFL